jgi:hypothetical protein
MLSARRLIIIGSALVLLGLPLGLFLSASEMGGPTVIVTIALLVGLGMLFVGCLKAWTKRKRSSPH